MSERIAFGQRLRARREELGLSLRAFGERVDLSASYLHDLEHGRRDPPLEDRVIKSLVAAGVGEAVELRALAYTSRGSLDVTGLTARQVANVLVFIESIRGAG
jgi:transcriptional regulator with XRE-family HTH domain